jgi:hypothetical protein
MPPTMPVVEVGGRRRSEVIGATEANIPGDERNGSFHIAIRDRASGANVAVTFEQNQQGTFISNAYNYAQGQWKKAKPGGETWRIAGEYAQEALKATKSYGASVGTAVGGSLKGFGKQAAGDWTTWSTNGIQVGSSAYEAAIAFHNGEYKRTALHVLKGLASGANMVAAYPESMNEQARGAVNLVATLSQIAIENYGAQLDSDETTATKKTGDDSNATLRTVLIEAIKSPEFQEALAAAYAEGKGQKPEDVLDDAIGEARAARHQVRKLSETPEVRQEAFRRASLVPHGTTTQADPNVYDNVRRRGTISHQNNAIFTDGYTMKQSDRSPQDKGKGRAQPDDRKYSSSSHSQSPPGGRSRR